LILEKAEQKEDPFRIIIADQNLPEAGSDSPSSKLAVEYSGDLPHLFLMTGIGQTNDLQRGFEAEICGIIEKPVSGQALESTLSEWFSRQRRKPQEESGESGKDSDSDLSGILGEQTARLLLVEDNITNQQVILAMLNKFGLSADAVANGREAVKALESIPYHIVLMDVQMPVMDGLDATRTIRDSSSMVIDHDITVIALTAYAMEGDREKCLAAGMNDYIDKPVSPERLKSTLRSWLKKIADSRDEINGHYRKNGCGNGRNPSLTDQD
jgi:CheY-like chemotaxis protein